MIDQIGPNYIGFQKSQLGNSFATINPKELKDNQYTLYTATEDEINIAAQLAEKAFYDYAELNGSRRAAFLEAIAIEIEAIKEDIVKVYCSESGLPQGRANGELGRTCFQLRSYANHIRKEEHLNLKIDTADEERQPMPKPDLRKLSIPIGPIAVFGSSNFPLAYSTAGGDTASALAAGCTVVLKAHPMHAVTSSLVALAILKAAKFTEMPEGVFSHLNSNTHQEGQLLVSHPAIKGVGFTGSLKGGRALFDLASKRKTPIPVFAEMGSVNPLIILPKAIENKEHWTTSIAASMALAAGQFCTNPGLLILFKDENSNAFISDLTQSLNDTLDSCMLHPSIFDNFQKNKAKLLAQKGVQLLSGSYLVNSAEKNINGEKVLAKVSAKNFIENPELHEEVFGVFSLIIEIEHRDDLFNMICSLDGQLTGSILGEEDEFKTFEREIRMLGHKVGRLIFNGVPTGVEVCESMLHGGPYPSTTDSRYTAVGVDSIQRWLRPLSYQNCPETLLPETLHNKNNTMKMRRVNSKFNNESIL